MGAGSTISAHQRLIVLPAGDDIGNLDTPIDHGIEAERRLANFLAASAHPPSIAEGGFPASASMAHIVKNRPKIGFGDLAKENAIVLYSYCCSLRKDSSHSSISAPVKLGRGSSSEACTRTRIAGMRSLCSSSRRIHTRMASRNTSLIEAKVPASTSALITLRPACSNRRRALPMGHDPIPAGYRIDLAAFRLRQ